MLKKIGYMLGDKLCIVKKQPHVQKCPLTYAIYDHFPTVN